MNNEDFKVLADRNKHNLFDLCFEYYVNEAKDKGYKIATESYFMHNFQIWLMMMNMGDVSESLNRGVEQLKKEYSYEQDIQKTITK